MNQGNERVVPGDQAVMEQGSAPAEAAPNNANPEPAAPVAEGGDSIQSPVNAAADGSSVGAAPQGGESLDPTAAADAAGMVGASEPTDLVGQLVHFMTVGGPVVWILSAFSVVALSIVLLKLWQFARLRPESAADVEQGLALWRQGETTAALAALQTRRPVSELVDLAMRGLSMNRERELLREELTRLATLRLSQLRAWLRPLEVIATLSPLLGLLGTVLGMIVAFQQMEAAGSQVDPSVLSGGIWQALLTTAVGLAVAIPVMTLHNWLERKVERIATLMNDAVTRVFTGGLAIHAEELQAKKVFEHAA